MAMAMANLTTKVGRVEHLAQQHWQRVADKATWGERAECDALIAAHDVFFAIGFALEDGAARETARFLSDLAHARCEVLLDRRNPTPSALLAAMEAAAA